jgi:hypothetical protein
MILVSIASLKINAQTTDTLKQKLSKEWIINQYEQFGVVDDPEEAQKNDKLVLNADMTCTIVENGKTYSGKWVIEKTRTYIVCTLKEGTIKRNYKIISVNNTSAILEYQSPDLIRTKYHVTAK